MLPEDASIVTEPTQMQGSCLLMRDLMPCPRRLDVSDACRLVTPVTDMQVAVCMLPSVVASESSKGNGRDIWLDLFPGGNDLQQPRYSRCSTFKRT
jgi:hypothetical protein